MPEYYSVWNTASSGC